MAAPPVRGVIDTEGIACIQPRRAGRRPQQIGRQGRAHQRWLVGGPLGWLLHPYGWVGAWAWATTQVADPTLQGLLRQGDDRLMILSAPACHAAQGAPSQRTVWQRGAWPDRRLVETGLSMRPVVCPCKQGRHRVWAYVQARRACTLAAFHGLVQGQGFQPQASGVVPLSMAALRW